MADLMGMRGAGKKKSSFPAKGAVAQPPVKGWKSTAQAANPPKSAMPNVPKSGGINSPTNNGPNTSARAAQYTAGSPNKGQSMGNMPPLSKAATPTNAKIVGNDSRGDASKSTRDKTPGTNGQAGNAGRTANAMEQHPQTHDAFHKLGVPKNGKY